MEKIFYDCVMDLKEARQKKILKLIHQRENR